MATIELNKSEVFAANRREINRGGMPVSHHRDFAMMPTAQFWDAGFSLGMPHLFIGFHANGYTTDVFHILVHPWVAFTNWKPKYWDRSIGIYNVPFLGTTTDTSTNTVRFSLSQRGRLLSNTPGRHLVLTSSNGNIFRVTGPLCGEFTGLRWIPRTKASNGELWCFLWSALE